jgi:predicted nucleic acid-binding protein
MRIAVTDACIFIDLFDIELINPFFQLSLDIHTTIDVFNELNAIQQQVLMAYISVGKLTLHSMQEQDRKWIQSMQVPKALSSADKTVLYLARKLDAMLLSSDRAVRNMAELQSVECHGMLWLFDQWVDYKILTKQSAVQKLQDLFKLNLTWQSEKMQTEVGNRIKSWKL